MVITMAKLRIAHASTHGASKPPGPKKKEEEERLNDGDNNGQATHGARKPPGPKALPVDQDLNPLCWWHVNQEEYPPSVSLCLGKLPWLQKGFTTKTNF